MGTRNMLRSDFNICWSAQRHYLALVIEADIAGNNAMVAESRSAKQQAQWVGKLTLLAFFYILASFTTSLFVMNFKEFGQGELRIWIWVALLVLTYALSLSVLYLNFGRLKHLFRKEESSEFD